MNHANYFKDIQKVLLAIPERHVTRKLLESKPIPEAVHIIYLSDANKTGPYFSSKLAKLNALYPAMGNSNKSDMVDTVLDNLETLHLNKELQKIIDSDGSYTRLPDSLNLEELVKLSSRIKTELRELLFMLDNIPDFLNNGGLDSLEKRNSIQRHKKTGSMLSRTDSVKTIDPFENMSDDEDEDESDLQSDTSTKTREKRKSNHFESMATTNSDRRKSFKREATFERRSSVSGTSSPERRTSKTSTRRHTIQRDIPPSALLDTRKTSLHRRQSKSPEGPKSYNPYLPGGGSNTELMVDSLMQVPDLSTTRRRSLLQGPPPPALPELDSEFMNREELNLHTPPPSATKEHIIKRKEPNRAS